MKCKIMFMCFLLVLFTGCQGASKAQDSLAVGMKINAEVRQAFFIKAFTLNRALITESRQKWINEAKKQTATGVLTAKEIAKVLAELNRNLGLDESITSENFGYLSYLLVAGERADQYLAQADIFIESQKPIWKHLSKSGRKTGEEVVEEIEAWQPLIRNIRSVIPKSLLRKNE